MYTYSVNTYIYIFVYTHIYTHTLIFPILYIFILVSIISSVQNEHSKMFVLVNNDTEDINNK